MAWKVPYTLVDGHIMFEVDGKKVLLDTGSPVSLGSCGTLEIDGSVYEVQDSCMTLPWNDLRMLIGIDVDALLGMDVISEFDLTLNPVDSQVTFDRENRLEDRESVQLRLFAEIPVLEVKIQGRPVKVFFDTGARLSYIDRTLTWAGECLGHEFDFHPSMGRFETQTFMTTVEIDGYEAELKTGVLPESLRRKLIVLGIKGILGTTLLEHYTITFSSRGRCIKLIPRAVSGNPFLKLVHQAGRNRWCVKYMCTTCGARDYRSRLEKISDLAGAMASADLEELVKIRNWDGALEVAFFDLPTACDRERVLTVWLEKTDCPVRFADVVLYYIVGRDLTARFNRDLWDGWVEKCASLAQESRDFSLAESLVRVLGKSVERYPDVLDIAFKSKGDRTMYQALSSAGFLPTQAALDRRRREKSAAERATRNLFGAVRRRDVKAVAALLKKGADPEAVNAEGKSIVELAEECGNEEIKELVCGGETNNHE